MIGLDTNVLVRFLVRDDDAQELEAAQLLTGLSQRGATGFVPDVVLAELSWVLERCYSLNSILSTRPSAVSPMNRSVGGTVRFFLRSSTRKPSPSYR